MKVLIFFFLVFGRSFGTNGNRIQQYTVLTDFLKTTSESNHVNAFLCWTTCEIYSLSNACFKKGLKFRANKNGSQFLDYPLEAEEQVNVIDAECAFTQSILNQASDLGFLKKPFKWIIFGNITTIGTFNFHPATDSVFYVIDKHNKGYTIKTVHKANKTFENFFHTQIGTWNPERGIEDYHPLSMYDGRKNLNGSLFTLGFWASNPSTYKNVEEYRFTHIDASIMFTYIITQLLTSMLNATRIYRVYKPSYLPLFEDLRTGKSIIGAMPVFFVGSRLPWMEYLAPNTPSYMSFIFRAPPLSYVSNIFTRPFHSYVWYCSFILCGITFCVMYIIVHWEWKEESFRMTIESLSDATKPSADNIAVLQMGVVSQQGSDTELKSLSGRIAFVFSLVSFMFLYTAYSGMIVALLQSTANMITSLDDLLYSGIDLGVENLSYAIPQFKHATETVKKEIYTKKLASKGDKYIMTLNEGVERMRTQFFAFHTEQTSAYKIVGDTFQEGEKCKLQEITYVNIVEPWIAATKNHTYKELIKAGLFRLKEVGFYKAERMRIFKEKPKCTGKISNFVSAGVVDTYAAFLFFGVGVMISAGIFAIELIMASSFKSYMKKIIVKLKLNLSNKF